MPDLEDHVALHPATVSNAEVHAETAPKRVRHRSPRNYAAEYERRQKEQPRHIRSVRVDPQVWATAMQLAGGEVGRIVVHSEGEVVVANHSRHTRPVMTPQFELTAVEDEPTYGSDEPDAQALADADDALTITGARPTDSGRSGPGKSVVMNAGQVFTCPICGKKFSNKLGHNRPAQGRGLHMYRSHGVKPEDYDGNHALLEPTDEVEES